MINKNFKKNFVLKSLFLVVAIASIMTVIAYSIAEIKLKQDIDNIEKRTLLQLNIAQDRILTWLDRLNYYAEDLISSEPIKTFSIQLINKNSIEDNKQNLENEKAYVQTLLDSFVYQNSLKSVGLINRSGDVYLSSGDITKFTELKQQTALLALTEEKIKYLPLTNQNEKLVLEIFMPIYGFMVNSSPVAVLYMSLNLDKEFVNLLTTGLPIEETEKLLLWQKANQNGQIINYHSIKRELRLVNSTQYNLGFYRNTDESQFIHTKNIEGTPFNLTLLIEEITALKYYKSYVYSLRMFVVLVIVIILAVMWSVFSKIVVKRYKKEIKYKEMLAEQSEKTVNALVKTLELRDSYLAGHYSNVKNMALKIAYSMNLNTDEISTLKYSAQLAGIGKIAIPKNILTKPEKLTADETRIMQSHVNFAEEILEDIGFDLPIKEVVSQMYERLDGSGYPRALVGSEINQLSRILAICDVFCALTAPRAYRNAKSNQEALEIMQKDINGFDSDILAILFKVIKS